jgi:hypothetical protein
VRGERQERPGQLQRLRDGVRGAERDRRLTKDDLSTIDMADLRASRVFGASPA